MPDPRDSSGESLVSAAEGIADHEEEVFSANRIAELLAGPDGTPLTPTAEQAAVIEHPLAGSTLVVAGAGSGKTETMANRVVYLIANGFAAPEQVLGLTFTR